jgi:hypothetical protein
VGGVGRSGEVRALLHQNLGMIRRAEALEAELREYDKRTELRILRINFYGRALCHVNRTSMDIT